MTTDTSPAPGQIAPEPAQDDHINRDALRTAMADAGVHAGLRHWELAKVVADNPGSCVWESHKDGTWHRYVTVPADDTGNGAPVWVVTRATQQLVRCSSPGAAREQIERGAVMVRPLARASWDTVRSLEVAMYDGRRVLHGHAAHFHLSRTLEDWVNEGTNHSSR